MVVSPNTTFFSKQEAAILRQTLRQWYKSNARDLPWRRTHDPYAILVSEYMLQQTTVAAALPYYQRWMERFPNIFELARASEETVLRYWQGLGYYSRAKNLLRTAQYLVNRYRGRFPSSPKELEQLPGIGPYTAGAVAAFAFDLPCIVLDSNIIRVLARLTNYAQPIDTKDGREHLQNVARSLLPLRDGRIHNSSLMELGATVCTARSPQCLMCPIKKHCRAQNPLLIPAKTPRPPSENRIRRAAFHAVAGKILLQQSSGPHWRGLWTLPHLEKATSDARLITEEKYTVTRFNITLQVYQVTEECLQALQNRCKYIPLEKLPETPLPSPHRRVISHLLTVEHCLA
jgi:A/G-specific adenine glycosylase